MNQVIAAFVGCVIIGINGLSHAKCTARGKFPNNQVLNCKGYTMCLSGAGDSFAEYDLDCPTNFVYSHIDSQCTNITSYQCLPDYNCTNSGNFVDSNDCTKYVACVEDLKHKIIARLITCPENTIYNVDQAGCVNGSVDMCNGASKPDNVNVGAPTIEVGFPTVEVGTPPVEVGTPTPDVVTSDSPIIRNSMTLWLLSVVIIALIKL